MREAMWNTREGPDLHRVGYGTGDGRSRRLEMSTLSELKLAIKSSKEQQPAASQQ